MNGEPETERDDSARDEQIFARPAWLQDFSEPREQSEPRGRDGGFEPPPRGTRADDDDIWEPEPTGWRATVDRVRTTPRAALALIAVGVIAAVVAILAVFGSSAGGSGEYPVVDFAGASSSVSAGAAPRAASVAPSVAAPSELVVAVVGLVRSPGLHRLRTGARVADALTAARGAVAGADTAGLNLAQPLRDGDQVVVGVVDPRSGVKLRSSVVSGGTSGAATPSAGRTASGAGAGVNINTADATELDRLPGVGAATAAAIIAYRDKNGPFATVDDLAKVSGIGAAKVAKIKPMATV